MKKKYLLLFFIILLLFSIFSCPDNSLKVTFVSYDVNTGKYTTKHDIRFNSGDLFGEINRPTINPFDEEGWTYSVKHWTDSVPIDGTIDIYNDPIDDYVEIIENKTVFAVYKSVRREYTVTFKTFDTESKTYKEFTTTDKISYKKMFGQIDKPTTIPTIDDYIGKKYTFSGQWTLETTTDGKVNTLGEALSYNTPITKDITLYAVYNSQDVNYTIAFKAFNTFNISSPGYKTTFYSRDISYGTLLKNVKNYPKIDSIPDYFGVEYTFSHWTTEEPIENDIKIIGTDYGNETPVTSNMTLYAVYTISKDVKYTVTFKTFNGTTSYEDKLVNDEVSYGQKFREIEKPKVIDDIVIGGVKYSFYGWADIENSSVILENYKQKNVDENTSITSTSNKSFCAIYQGDYLSFMAVENTQISFDIVGTLNNNISLKYRKDSDPEFTDYTWGSSTSARSGTGQQISLNKGDKVYFKGSNTTFSKDSSNYVHFKSTGVVNASGSVMSITSQYYKIPSSISFFKNLFKLCTTILTPPSLPATELYPECYFAMFSESSIIKAPELPATTIEGACYYEMFRGCAALTTAPDILPATVLRDDCYNRMFRGCISLLNAPELPALKLTMNCYYEMFYGCSSLVTPPSLPATQISLFSYQGMFQNCKSLTKAPDLPATDPGTGAYKFMFSGCSSLTKAPDLPLPTISPWIARECYYGMFEDCKSLTTAPELPATELGEKCYFSMFNGCSSLENAPELPATVLGEACYSFMFAGCSSLKKAPDLPATKLAKVCYEGMFSGCTSLENAPELPATELAERCYCSMFSRCTSLKTAPVLKASELPTNAYSNMFQNCSSLDTIKVYATKCIGINCTDMWVDGVKFRGTFYCKNDEESSIRWSRNYHGIPYEWFRVDL